MVVLHISIHPLTFTVRAVEPTTAIFFDLTLLQEYCELDHSFGYEFLKRMSLGMFLRMQAVHTQMLNIHHRSQPVRLSSSTDTNWSRRRARTDDRHIARAD